MVTAPVLRSTELGLQVYLTRNSLITVPRINRGGLKNSTSQSPTPEMLLIVARSSKITLR